MLDLAVVPDFSAARSQMGTTIIDFGVIWNYGADSYISIKVISRFA